VMPLQNILKSCFDAELFIRGLYLNGFV